MAFRKTTTQSSISSGGESSRAVDGNNDSDYYAWSCTHTAENVPSPWWQVDLSSTAEITQVQFDRLLPTQSGSLGKGFLIV